MKLNETHGLILRYLVLSPFFYWIFVEYLVASTRGSLNGTELYRCFLLPPGWVVRLSLEISSNSASQPSFSSLVGFWPHVPKELNLRRCLYIIIWATVFLFLLDATCIFRSWLVRFFVVKSHVHNITHIRISISKLLFHLVMYLFHSLWRRYRQISPLLTCGYVAWQWVPPAVVEAYSYQLAPVGLKFTLRVNSWC